MIYELRRPQLAAANNAFAATAHAPKLIAP